MRSAWTLALVGCSFQLGVAAQPPAGTDAPPSVDAAVDAGPVQPPTVIANAHGHNANMSSLTFSLAIPSTASSRLLLVSAQTGENACPSPGPAVTAVTYDGMMLTRIASMVGVPNCSTDTRSEIWALAAAPTGTHDVVITLSANQQTLHGGAVAFAGVDPTTPVRDMAMKSGATASSSVPVTSAVGDLVVSFCGQGTQINDAGAGSQATILYIDNVTNSTSLDDTAVSTLPGAASVTSVWRFGGSDNWQDIALSLRPS